MRNLLLSLCFMVSGIVGYSAPKEEYAIKNSPCENCILVTVIGHGVAEGYEGRYYFPLDYTIERFWKDRPVPLHFPHDRFMVKRSNPEGKEDRYLVDVRKETTNSKHAEFILKAGDIVFVSQPII